MLVEQKTGDALFLHCTLQEVRCFEISRCVHGMLSLAFDTYGAEYTFVYKTISIKLCKVCFALVLVYLLSVSTAYARPCAIGDITSGSWNSVSVQSVSA